MRVCIVGGGAFGLSTSIELSNRGHAVTVFDRYPIPAFDASSNDISRIIRMDYGEDEFFTSLAAKAMKVWNQWNEEAVKDGVGKLYNEVGIVSLTKNKFSEGGYEKCSYDMIQKYGAKVERLEGAGTAGKKFPAWEKGGNKYIDGYFNSVAGWANPNLTLNWLARKAVTKGVTFVTGKGGNFVKLISQGEKVVGIVTSDGKEHYFDSVVICTGAWSPSLIPELQNQSLIHAVGHPVVYFKVPNHLLSKFRAPNFPVFLADISKTGWYGFPVADDGNLLKLGNHGNGFVVNKKLEDGRICSVPDSENSIPVAELQKIKEFVYEAFPDLKEANAELVKTRICWYCDSWDGYFYVDRIPNKEGVVIACGSSGHGFKFTPIIGGIISDALEKKNNLDLEKFKWRPFKEEEKKPEACRFTDSTPIILSKL